ncbi:pogo transposable element with KRAB domain [Rhizophagus irregularis DAOM 181602=DAOM 197198]|nr:pogo transposable element with KRAB domain [Rhizophagus irregularis DAOM 181602=DAOM 197198]
MLWWVENVWTSRNRFGNPRSMLVLDSFRRYIVNSVKNRLVKKNTNIAMIPGSCTSKLQPLDVAINKSFKSKDEVDENLIQRSFKSCEISTNINGSEDDCIFDHDSLLNRDNEVLENLDNSTDENYEEEYSEETNYENKWDVKVVIEVGHQKEDNDESESEKEEDDGNYDYQDSDDQEEMRHRLNELKKYISSIEFLHTSKCLARDIIDEQELQIIPKTANKTSWRNVNTISGEFTYQNPLLSLLLEQNFTTPNYFLYNESAVRDFPGVSGVNYFDLEREATKLRVLEKE